MYIITQIVYIYIFIFISSDILELKINVFQTIAISASFNYPEATLAEQ